MSLSQAFQDKKTADLLWRVAKTIQEQITDESLDPKKMYTVKVSGVTLMTLFRRAKFYYERTRR